MTQIFWGEVIKVSNDAGPYKGVRVQADGHEFSAQVVESGGYHQSPMEKSQVLIALPDGDMGKAVIIGGQAPKDRVDGQKEGMVTFKNHKRGQTVEMDDSGNVNITCSGNVTMTAAKLIVTADVEITGAVEITGDITHTGANTQTGIHVDSNGPHTA